MDLKAGAMKRKSGPQEEADGAAVKVPRLNEAGNGRPPQEAAATGVQLADRPPATVIHEVAVPEGTVYQPKAAKPGSKPAKEYPFVLDPFQVSTPPRKTQQK